MKKIVLTMILLLVSSAAAVELSSMDFDNNNEINLDDLLLQISDFGKSADFNQVYDINQDGRVSIFDLVLVAKNLGKTYTIETKGVFPLVRKSQAIEWDGQWKVKQEFLDMLDKDYVSGVTLYLSWAELEPSKGQYAWNQINVVVSAAKERGKKVHLGLAASQFSPDWIYNEGVESYSYHKTEDNLPEGEVLAPLPWDEKYLELYFNFVKAFATKVRENPEVYSPIERVMIGGPTNTLGFEPVLKGSSLDRDYYKQNGYPEQFVNAWKQAVDVYSSEFPNQELNFVWHRGMQGEWTNQYSKEIVDYIYSQGLTDKVNLMSLGLKGQDWYDFTDVQHPKGDPTLEKEMLLMLEQEQERGFDLAFQFFSRDDTSDELRTEELGNYGLALQNAIDMNSSWVEPWAEDIMIQSEGTTTFERREQLLNWANKQLK